MFKCARKKYFCRGVVQRCHSNLQLGTYIVCTLKFQTYDSRTLLFMVEKYLNQSNYMALLSKESHIWYTNGTNTSRYQRSFTAWKPLWQIFIILGVKPFKQQYIIFLLVTYIQQPSLDCTQKIWRIRRYMYMYTYKCAMGMSEHILYCYEHCMSAWSPFPYIKIW